MVINRAEIISGDAATPSNNRTYDITTVARNPDLTVTSLHARTFVRGRPNLYTLIVTNVGNGPSYGKVTVADRLPAGMAVVRMAGSGWTCDVSTASCTREDVLASGASYPPILLVVSVAATVPRDVTSVVEVSGAGDAAAGNNTATDPTVVTGPPVLPPWFRVIRPPEITREASVRLSGTAQPRTAVLAGEVQVVADRRGNWSAVVPLQEGLNVILVSSGSASDVVVVERVPAPRRP